MSIKLRLLLFYLNNFTKTEFGDAPVSIIRKLDREQRDKAAMLLDYAAIDLHQVDNRSITMRDGESIPIRIYRPTAAESLPIVVFFHGGGFVIRDIDSHDKTCRRIAHTSQVVVVSVGYRLAPEYKFPIPMQDAYDATLWVAEHAPTLGGDREQLIVMGDSAGGNLATVTAIQARDLGVPKIAKQVLIYPATDARMQHPSIDNLAKGYLLNKSIMQWFIRQYKRTDEDLLNPLMSPLLTENLSKLPSAFVITASHDPLKDEGKAYADSLVAAGNEVHFKEYKGTIHDFLTMPRLTQQTLRLHEDIRDFIKPNHG